MKVCGPLVKALTRTMKMMMTTRIWRKYHRCLRQTRTQSRPQETTKLKMRFSKSRRDSLSRKRTNLWSSCLCLPSLSD